MKRGHYTTRYPRSALALAVALRDRGHALQFIADAMMAAGIKTAHGRDIWSRQTVKNCIATGRRLGVTPDEATDARTRMTAEDLIAAHARSQRLYGLDLAAYNRSVRKSMARS